jgi:carboxymethylenebutenolidase
MCHESWQPTSAAAAAESLTYTSTDGAEITAWLAEHGFDAVMIDYCFREGPIAEVTRAAAFERRSTMHENQCLRDIGSVLHQLPGQQPGTRIAVIGFCLSGTYAYDLTAVRSDLATREG